MLRGFAAQQRYPHEFAGLGDSPHDGGNALGHHLAARDVIGHEERGCSHHHDVIYHHAHKVLADRIVNIHSLSDGHLGTHAVRRGC